jgi:hypothetical protein
MQVDPRYRRAQAETIHRSFGMILVVILLVVAAVLWVQSQVNPPPPSTTVIPFNSGSIEIELPGGWLLAESSLTPFLGGPIEVFSAGTFALQVGGDQCAHVPERAMEDLGPRDAFLTLQETTASSASFSVRPASFGPLLEGITPGDAYECITEDERGDVGTLLWHPFRVGDHGFYLLVVLGTEVNSHLRQQTIDLLDSLRFTS